MPSPKGGFSSGVALAITSLRALASAITFSNDGVISASVACSSLAILALQKAPTTARGSSPASATPASIARIPAASASRIGISLKPAS